MTVAQAFTIIRFITNTNATTAVDATLLRSMSERHKQMFIELTKLKEGYGETSATVNTVNGTQGYTLPTDMIRLKRVEIQYATDGTWRPVKIFDINEASSTNDTTTIASNFSKDEPYGDLVGTTFNLYPIPDASVTGGLKWWYIANPADLTATSDTPTAPAEYHRLLCDLVAIDIRKMKAELSGSTALVEEEAIWRHLKNQVSPRALSQDNMVKPLRVK